MKRQVFMEHPKKIVNKVSSPDVGMMYSVNPYQGCEHGCVYCYARNAHTYWGFSAGLDFEQKLIAKPDAAKLLEAHFLKKHYLPVPISLSGNTDCYQPLERQMKLTQALLRIFAKYRNPVGIISKNALMERDIDLFKELAEQDLVHIYFSITSQDESLRRVLEPRTANAAKRLKVMERFSKEGIPCGLMMAPLIPGLNVTEIPDLLKSAADAGARTAAYTVVRLNGDVGPIFEDWLYKTFPDRADKVWHQIQELHGGQVNDSDFGRRMRGEGTIANMISQLFKKTREKHFAGRSMPSYNYEAFRRGGNYELF